MKKKIAVICSSRATYGYKKRIIQLLRDSDKVELQVFVTGMHLVPEYGYTVDELKRDKVPITCEIDMMISGSSPVAWTKSIGVEIINMAQVFEIYKPDLVLVTGHRQEMFGATVTAAYMNLPVAHIQAGDVSGHIDGSARHAITKLSHLHLASCEDSATRVKNLGEEEWRIHNVGAPQLDDILFGERADKAELESTFGFDFSKPVLLVLQHPVHVEHRESARQMGETLRTVKELEYQTIVIYPNIDSGNSEMIAQLQRETDYPWIRLERNLERRVFIGLLNHVSVLVGNSSCGILEAPSFKLPAVNIGNRQRGRMQASNVINTANTTDEIKTGIEKALNDSEYRKQIETCVNPYGDGKSSERIVKILEDLEINKALLDKTITY